MSKIKESLLDDWTSYEEEENSDAKEESTKVNFYSQYTPTQSKNQPPAAPQDPEEVGDPLKYLLDQGLSLDNIDDLKEEFTCSTLDLAITVQRMIAKGEDPTEGLKWREKSPAPVMSNLTCMAFIEYHDPRWLLKPYLQKGKGTLIQGEPGCGKTAFALALAAHITTGKNLMGVPVEDPGNVLLLSTEDDPAALRGRFETSGGDVNRLYTWSDPMKIPNMTSDIIWQCVREINARLIILDPLQVFLGPSVDMNRANQTRPILSAFLAMAEQYDTAVVFIAHTSKGSGDRSAIYRSLGSVDIPAAMRQVLQVVPDTLDGSVHAVNIKSSNASLGKTIDFIIGDRGGVRWVGFSDLKLSDLERASGREAPAREDCKSFIIETLGKAGGELPANALDKLIEDAAFSAATKNRAKRELKESKRIRYDKRKDKETESDTWFVSVCSVSDVIK